MVENKLTIYRVVRNRRGFKVWRIVKCAHNPELVGTPAAYGVPGRAKHFDLGTEYKTDCTLTIPEEVENG